MRKATKKDMQPVNEKTVKFGKGVKSNLRGADLKDHSGHATIRMRWGMNSAMERDAIFVLSIDGHEAFIDLEELLSYTRLM